MPRPRLTSANVQALQGYEWPGNVRELQNVIERAVILSQGGDLEFNLPLRQVHDGPANRPMLMAQAVSPGRLSFDELKAREREIVATALRRTNGKIYGTDGAAALLRVKPTTLVSKMKRLQVHRQRA